MFDNQTLAELASLYQQDCGFVNTNEFRDIVLKFLYVGRMLRRYVNVGEINYRLLINHVIILHNVFNTKATELLLEYIDDELHPQLYALLHIINRLPQHLDETQRDQTLYSQLTQEINDGEKSS